MAKDQTNNLVILRADGEAEGPERSEGSDEQPSYKLWQSEAEDPERNEGTDKQPSSSIAA